MLRDAAYWREYRKTHRIAIKKSEQKRGRTTKRRAAARTYREQHREAQVLYLRNYRAKKGAKTRDMPATIGFIYLIQLEPELLPMRVKVGWASDPKRRLRNFRAVAPFAAITKTWSGTTLDEAALHRLLERFAVVPRRRGKACEVYEVPVEDAIAVVDGYFLARAQAPRADPTATPSAPGMASQGESRTTRRASAVCTP